MSTLSLRLPESLHEQVKILSKKGGISINQFIASAVAEKMSTLLTEDFLLQRAAQADEQAFLAAISKVPSVVPDEHDKL